MMGHIRTTKPSESERIVMLRYSEASALSVVRRQIFRGVPLKMTCFLVLMFCTTMPAQLAPMLKIAWSRGPNLPQGFQDSDGGFIGDTLVTAGGFCSGGLPLDNEKKPGVYP